MDISSLWLIGSLSFLLLTMSAIKNKWNRYLIVLSGATSVLLFIWWVFPGTSNGGNKYPPCAPGYNCQQNPDPNVTNSKVGTCFDKCCLGTATGTNDLGQSATCTYPNFYCPFDNTCRALDTAGAMNSYCFQQRQERYITPPYGDCSQCAALCGYSCAGKSNCQCDNPDDPFAPCCSTTGVCVCAAQPSQAVSGTLAPTSGTLVYPSGCTSKEFAGGKRYPLGSVLGYPSQDNPAYTWTPPAGANSLELTDSLIEYLKGCKDGCGIWFDPNLQQVAPFLNQTCYQATTACGIP